MVELPYIMVRRRSVMLEAILGNKTIEKVLLYLYAYKQGYAKGIAVLFNTSVNGIQQQLKRLEDGGIVVSMMKGNVRLYEFNPRYAFREEVELLLKKAMDYIPAAEKDKYYKLRTRPRRKGKPIWK